MRQVFLLAMCMVCFVSGLYAQDKPKVEVFAGFSVDSIDTGGGNNGPGVNISNRLAGLGFEVSGTGFLTQRWGIEGNFDGHFRRKTFDVFGSDLKTRTSTYNFMAGPHYRVTNSSRVTPFGHFLVGGNHTRFSTNFLGSLDSGRETDLAFKMGGGVDIGILNRFRIVGLRIGGDYNPVIQKKNGELNPNIGRRTRNDFVFSIGLVAK